MYAKCGALAKAADVLEELPVRDVATWSALISGYGQEGEGEEAFKCFRQMQLEGISPNPIAFVCILKACGSIRTIDIGAQLHNEIISQGLFAKDVLIGTTLVNMYANCGELSKAAEVLEELPIRNVVSWNALIDGYVGEGQYQEGLICFEQMLCEGLYPDAVTFTCILKVCGNLGALDMGKKFHQEVRRQRLLGKHVLGTTLVDMYAKCGALAEASQVLGELSIRDVISWNALITGYAQQGCYQEALKCFHQMHCEGLSPSIATCTSILKACGTSGAVDKGKQIHAFIVRQQLLEKDIGLGNTLVDMYAKCGALAKAVQVLDELPMRNVISWNAIISGYAQLEEGGEALKCFTRLQDEGLSPNAVTFTCILKACGSIGAAESGEKIHNEIQRQGLLGKDSLVGNALIDMYAKCGAFGKAMQVLDKLPVRNVVAWSALISGYAEQGQGEKAFKCLEQMRHEGLSPNTVTFSCVLNACSRSSLFEVGETCFADICLKCGIMPVVKHQTSMVNLFGRAGEFDKALAIIKKVPSLDDLPLWLALLGACQESGHLKLGRLAFENAIQIAENDSAAYLLMSKLVAAAGLQGAATLEVNVTKCNK